MRKPLAILLLPVLFLLAFLHANTSSVQKAVIAFNITSNSSLSSNSNLPGAEIERCNVSIETFSHNWQVPQRVPAQLTSNSKSREIDAALSSLPVYASVELYNNNHLSYNYPSHNFW